MPDGSQRKYQHGVSAVSIAESISPRLANVMLAVEVNGSLKDYNTVLEEDCSLRIITAKDDESLEIIRHSTAHLMAQAVKQLFPSVQITIGPVIENGFYYDFHYPEGFSEDDFSKIEAVMQELVAQELPVQRSMMSKKQAEDFFLAEGEDYKAKIINEIIDAENVSLYQQGDFIDLCRGPHVPNTKFLGAFKLTKVSGAYWRGDQNNEMLQRIYGTAWRNNKELKDYLQKLEMAKARDHRLLGAKLDWFHLQDTAPGMVFWHSNGWKIIQNMRSYLRSKLESWGYKEINTPQIIDRSLWEASGHWAKYADNMFVVESGKRCHAVKPMSCPGHVEMFKHGLKSYRDLPLRYAEFGCCHRNEASGTLHGLMRVRGFVQDDGHIFCHSDDVGSEIADFVTQVSEVYKKFGFKQFSVCLSTRPEQRVGSDAQWDKAENMLIESLNNVLGPDGWSLNPGEGAFYGPKVEFTLHDCMGRSWQCGTIQLDFEMPQRLGATFIDKDNSKQYPVMLHRAILGSFERFLGILIEENDARLPFWLMPVQFVVLNIMRDQEQYAKEIAKSLEGFDFRVELDLRPEKIGYKIREHSKQRVPYILVCGAKEQSESVVAVRDQHGNNLGTMAIDKLKDLVLGENY